MWSFFGLTKVGLLVEPLDGLLGAILLGGAAAVGLGVGDFAELPEIAGYVK